VSDSYPLDALFNPGSVAVVGASPDVGKPGGRCLAFLQKFRYPGRLYPVNPKYRTIGALTCYSDLSTLPAPVDLVVLLVPANAVAKYLNAAAAAGARAAIVCSSGFAEAGDEGAQLQQELVDAAESNGIAVLGPNCLGLVDLHHGLAASFSTALESDAPVKAGPIAFVSQSGAMGIAVFSVAQAEGVALGKFISTGNEAVLDFTHFLEYLADDPDVSLVLGYIEGVRDGRRFVSAARRARAAGKKVAVLKVGQSEAGERAARSHTGALAGSAKVYEAAFRRGGVRAVSDVRGLLDLAMAVPGQRAPAGKRMGIVNMSGGAGVMMADACSSHQLEVPTLSESTVRALAKVLPPFVSKANPVDYGPIYTDPDAIRTCVELVANDPAIDQVLVFIGLSPSLAGVIEQRLADVQARSGKPIIAAWLGGPEAGIKRLRELGIATFSEPVRAVAAAAHLVFFGQALPGPDVALAAQPSPQASTTRQALSAYVAAGRTSLSEQEVKRLIASYDIPVGAEVLATTTAEAVAAAKKFGRPVAVKAESPDLLHKSDAGAVKLNVAAAEVEQAFRAVVDAAAKVVGADKVRGALIQPMAQRGVEMLAGLRHDPQFGPTVTVGMGGVASEVLADAATELAPLDLELARSMIARLRGAPLLGAFRGGAAHDVDALARVLVALSELAIDAGPRLAELDLNPVIVHAKGGGCTVVDGAAVLGIDIQEDFHGRQ
jgi:acetyltransferase